MLHMMGGYSEDDEKTRSRCEQGVEWLKCDRVGPSVALSRLLKEEDMIITSKRGNTNDSQFGDKSQETTNHTGGRKKTASIHIIYIRSHSQ